MSLYEDLLQKQFLPHAYEDWAEYRNAISNYLIASTAADSTLAIFGAGCCNDWDLSLLAGHFSSITLIDNNLPAMKQALKRYQLETYPTIHLDECNLTGLCGSDYENFCDTLFEQKKLFGASIDTELPVSTALAFLHQTYEKNYNFAGTIFVDYENSGDFSDCNTLVYGHNMKNGSMFGHLKKFREDDKLYKQDKYFWILTPERNYRYEIITAYTTGVNSDTYTLFKGPGEEFEKYLETIKGYSEIQTDDTDLTIKDRIVTLSTCTGNESTRFVVQGKRVDAEDADGAATNTDSTADEENTDEISLDIAG